MRTGDSVIHMPTGDRGTWIAQLGHMVAVVSRDSGQGDPAIVAKPDTFRRTRKCDDAFHVEALRAIVETGDAPGIAGIVYMLCETALLDILEAKRKFVRVRAVQYTRFERVTKKGKR